MTVFMTGIIVVFCFAVIVFCALIVAVYNAGFAAGVKKQFDQDAEAVREFEEMKTRVKERNTQFRRSVDF